MNANALVTILLVFAVAALTYVVITDEDPYLCYCETQTGGIILRDG